MILLFCLAPMVTPDNYETVTERPPEFWKQVVEFWQTKHR